MAASWLCLSRECRVECHKSSFACVVAALDALSEGLVAMKTDARPDIEAVFHASTDASPGYRVSGLAPKHAQTITDHNKLADLMTEHGHRQ